MATRCTLTTALQITILILLCATPPFSFPRMGVLGVYGDWSHRYRDPTLSEVYMPSTSICITAPDQLQGCITGTTFSTAGFTFPVFGNQTSSLNAYNRSVPMVLPNSFDDSHGCFPLTHPFNDEGQSLGGSLVLIERGGGCSFSVKALHVSMLNSLPALQNNPIAGVFIFGCGIAGCEDTLLSPAAYNAFNTSAVYVASADGQLLKQYLTERRASLAANLHDPSITIPPPLIGSVMTTGMTSPSDISALRLLSQNLTFDPSVFAANSLLQSWSTFASAPLGSIYADPCVGIGRILGVFCEQGRVVSIDLEGLGVSGTFLPNAIGALTALRLLRISNNGLVGRIPNDLCNCSSLTVIMAQGNGFQSLPDCMGDVNQLQFLDFSSNSLESIPFSLKYLNRTLQVLVLSRNQIVTTSPRTNDELTNTGIDVVYMSLKNLIRLESFANPSLRMNLSNFRIGATHTSLQLLLLSDTSVYGILPADAFDFPLSSNNESLSSLQQLDLSSTSLSPGPLPAFEGCSKLQFVNLASNSFTGGIPYSWGDSLQSLTQLNLQENHLSWPYDALGMLGSLVFLNVSTNQIHNAPPSADVGQSLSLIISSSLQELHIDSNYLTGEWLNGWFVTQNLQKLSIRDNFLANLPSRMWSAPSLSWADFAANNITGDLPDGEPALLPTFGAGQQSTAWQYLNLQSNPFLSVWPLPDYIAIATPHQWQISSEAGGIYQCLALSSSIPSSFTLKVDPEFTSYRLCECSRGFFGIPPLCSVTPDQVVVSPFVLPQAPTVGTFFSSIINQTGMNGTTPQPDASGVILSPTELSTPCNSSATCARGITSPYPPAVTDGWFGDHNRFMSGLSTSWTLDLSYLLLSSSSTQDSTSEFDPSNGTVVLLSSNVTDAYRRDVYTPVRRITIRLHLSLPSFLSNRSSNAAAPATSMSISLLPSHPELEPQSQVLFLDNKLIADLPVNLTQAQSDYISSSEYQSAYGSAIALLPQPVVYTEVVVYSNRALVSFDSRDVSGPHFLLTYSYGFECSSSSDLGTSFVVDDELDRCVILPPASEHRSLVIIGGIASAVVLIALFLLLIERYKRQAERLKTQQVYGLGAHIAVLPSEESNKSTTAVFDDELQLRSQLVDALRSSKHRQYLREMAAESAGQLIDTFSVALNGAVAIQVSMADDKTYLQILFMAVAAVTTLGYGMKSINRWFVMRKMKADFDAHTQRQTKHQQQSAKISSIASPVSPSDINSASLQQDSSVSSLGEPLLENPAIEPPSAWPESEEVFESKNESEMVLTNTQSVASRRLQEEYVECRRQLDDLNRGIMRQHIIFLSVLFSVIPWTILNSYTLYSYGNVQNHTTMFISLLVSLMMGGSKIQSMLDYPRIRTAQVKAALALIDVQIRISTLEAKHKRQMI